MEAGVDPGVVSYLAELKSIYEGKKITAEGLIQFLKFISCIFRIIKALGILVSTDTQSHFIRTV
jgi:hypothetical protein